MATWPIDPDVRRIAKRFGVDAALIQAVVKAEGNILKAVQCSLPSVTTREEALEVTCRSAAHALFDFMKTFQPDPSVVRGDFSRVVRDAYVDFWSRRWAPVGAENDPTSLNGNWPKNVKAFWK